MPFSLCTVRSSRSADLEAHTRLLHGWQLEYDQLDCGSFEGEFLDVRLPGMQLFEERTSRCVRQRGVLSEDSVSVGLMLMGQGELVLNGVRPGRHGLTFVHDAELEMATPAGCVFAGAVVDAPLLQQTAHDLLGRPLKIPRGVMQGLVPAPGRFESLLSVLRASFQRIGEDTEAGVEARDALLVQLVHALSDARDADEQGRAAQRKALVDQACRLMLLRTDETPSLEEVCREVGASQRKLSYCFQDVLGMSPHRYARTLRLNGARRELLRSHDKCSSVYDVAARWGFWHFGRFSCDYKRQFGESPSHSQGRARTAG